MPSDMGMQRSTRSGRQRCSTSWWRSVALKGPAYDTNAAASSTSPICTRGHVHVRESVASGQQAAACAHTGMVRLRRMA